MIDFACLSRDLGESFQSWDLIREALTHSSFANENQGSTSNERLAFVGDAVVDLVVANFLFEHMPNANKGDLTTRRANLVEESSLAQGARRLHLDAHVLLGRGEESQGGRSKDGDLEGVLEALVAAVYYAKGFGAAMAVTIRALKLESSDAPSSRES